MSRLPKPSGCIGCPFYGDGKGYVPDERVPGAQVEVMGQNPGLNEEQGRRLVGYDEKREIWEPHPQAPYLGKTGYAMEQSYLPLAGLERGKNVDLSNAIRCRYKGTNALPPLSDPALRQAIEHCQQAHCKRPDTVRLIVAEGEYALYANTSEDGSDSPGHKISRGISGWRGYLLPFNPPPRPRQSFNHVYTPKGRDLVVLPTFHLAYLFRAPWDKPYSQADWSKVQRILRGAWPEAFPECNPEPPKDWPIVSGFDTEFYQPDKDSPQTVLQRWSLATRERGGEPRLYVVEANTQLPEFEIPPRVRIYFHNVEADQEHLRWILRKKVQIRAEDTMLEHGILWPDLGHKLDECGSTYARTNRHKHLLRSNPIEYAGGDALATFDLGMALDKELNRDPETRWIYENLTLPLVPIIEKNKRKGIPINQERVEIALRELDDLQRTLKDEARAITGFNFNLGSDDQVRHWIYQVEKSNINPISGRPYRGKR